MVLVVGALRQGRCGAYTACRLQALFGVTRATLARWQRYFQEIFPRSHKWLRLRARLWPPLFAEDLPTALIERFVQARGDPLAGLTICLSALLGASS